MKASCKKNPSNKSKIWNKKNNGLNIEKNQKIEKNLKHARSLDDLFYEFDQSAAEFQTSHIHLALCRIASFTKSWSKRSKRIIKSDNSFLQLLDLNFAVVTSYSSHQLVQILNAFAILEVNDEKTISKISELAIDIVPTLNAQECISILYSYAITKIKSIKLIKALQIHISKQKIPFDIKSKEFSLFVQSIALLEAGDILSKSSLLILLKRITPFILHQEIISIIWSLARLNVYYYPIIERICKFAKFDLSKDIKSRKVYNLMAWAMCRLMHYDYEFFELLKYRATREIHLDNAIVLNSFAVLGKDLDKVFLWNICKTTNIVLNCSRSELISLIWTLALTEKLNEGISQRAIDSMTKMWMKNKTKFESLKKIQCMVLHMQMLARMISCKIILETSVHKNCAVQWMRKNITINRRQNTKNISDIMNYLKIKNNNIRTNDGLMCIDIHFEHLKTKDTSFKSMFRPFSIKNSEIQGYSNRWIAYNCSSNRLGLNFLETHAFLRNHTWVIHSKTQTHLQLLKSRNWEICLIPNRELTAVTNIQNKVSYISKISRVIGHKKN